MSNNIMEVTNKTPIEIALQIDDEGFTTAKKLYTWLELDQSHYARWIKENITENPFAEENEYSPCKAKTSKRGGRPTGDYKITASLAKRISMATKSKRGEEARLYFIGCEQTLAKLAEQQRKTEIERAKGIAVRQALTKAIQQSGENERTHGHAYSLYTDLIYKTVFGKNAKQLREEYRITKKDNLRDLFAQEELAKVKSVEMVISGLVNCGWGYNEIKEFVTDNTRKLIAVA